MVGRQGMARPPKNFAGNGHDHPYRCLQPPPILNPGRGLAAQAEEERIGRTIPPDLPVQLTECTDDGPSLVGLFTGQDEIALGVFDRGTKRRTDVIPGTARLQDQRAMRLGESVLQNRGQALAAPLAVEHFEMAPGAERAPGPVRQEYGTKGQRMVMMMGFPQPVPGMGNTKHQRPSRGVVDPFTVGEGPPPLADPGRLAGDLSVDLLEQGEMDGHGVEPPTFKGFADFRRQGPEDFVGGNGSAGGPGQEQPTCPILPPEQLFRQVHGKHSVLKFPSGQADRKPKVGINEGDAKSAVCRQESLGTGKHLAHLGQSAEMTVQVFPETVQRPRCMPGIAVGVTEEDVHGLLGVHAQILQGGEGLLHLLVPVEEEEGDQAVGVDPLLLGPLLQLFPGFERRAPEVQLDRAVALAGLHPSGFHFEPADLLHFKPP